MIHLPGQSTCTCLRAVCPLPLPLRPLSLFRRRRRRRIHVTQQNLKALHLLANLVKPEWSNVPGEHEYLFPPCKIALPSRNCPSIH